MKAPESTGEGRSRLPGLIALNAGLLCLLALVTFGAVADAQIRPRGKYTMVTGRANGALADVVYIVDTVNQEMIAVTFDPNEKQLNGIGYQNLAGAARTATRSRSGN
jgi:hypothetical protein